MRLDHEKVKALVDGHRFKRSAIADECGVEVETLTSYLNGHANPGRAVLKHLARVLGVTEADLLQKNKEQNQATKKSA